MADIQNHSEADIKSFVESLGDQIDARPNENGDIFRHILNQLREGAKLLKEERLKGKTGYERVIVLEANGRLVAKRIFHPRDYKGVDFAISKIRDDGLMGISVIQVKRNHGKPNFTLTEDKNTKELNQLRTFSQWPSSYYLMVDESVNPPNDIFITTSEIISLISSLTGNSFPFTNLTKVDIPNSQIMKYARGSRIFYKSFYDCRRGAKTIQKEFVNKAISHVKTSDRALVELFVSRKHDYRSVSLDKFLNP
jgi:hypothetical protein